MADFWSGLLAGWLPAYQQSYKAAVDKEYKDRDYALAKQKFEDEMRYKQEQLAYMKPYYEANTERARIEGGLLQSKQKMMDDLGTTPKSLFDETGGPTLIPGASKPTSEYSNQPWVQAESGGSTGAFNPSDGSGPSIGPYQINYQHKDAIKPYLASNGIDPNTNIWDKSTFDQMKDDPKFLTAQKQFINDNHTKPAIQIAQKAGLDINDPRVVSAVESAAVQHGPKGLANLLELAKANGDFSNTDNAIASIYKTRAAVFPTHAKRYEGELAQTLRMPTQRQVSETPQTQQTASLPDGSFDVAAGPSNSATDAPNGFGRPQAEGGPSLNIPQAPAQSAPANTGSTGALAKYTTEQLQALYSKGAAMGSKYQNSGLHNPYAGDMELIKSELQQRNSRQDTESRYEMSQTPKKYKDMQTGDYKLLTPLQYNKAVSSGANLQEYNDNPQGLESRIKQNETIITNFMDSIFKDPNNANFFKNQDGSEMSPEDKQRVAMSVISKMKPELVREFTQDLEKYRGLNTQTGTDNKGNKIMVEGRYGPTTEQLAGSMADVGQYNKVSHEQVKGAYNTLTGLVEGKKQELMSSGVDEATAYEKAKEFAKSTPEGSKAYDVINQAYNGGESPIKTGRVTTLGNKTMTRGDEKNVTEVDNEVKKSEMLDLSLKQALVRPGESITDISDQKMDDRIADHLNALKKMGVNSYAQFSRLFDPQDTSLSPELKQYATENLQILKLMDERFFQKRKETTGVVFSPQETASYAKVWPSSGSTPEDYRAIAKNERIQREVKKDYINSMKNTGAWDKTEALSRFEAREREKQAKNPSAPTTQTQGATKPGASFMAYGD